MQFKSKAIALAVSLSFTGGAFAAIDNYATGNGELLFTVFDPTTNVSYTRDLEALPTAPTMGSFDLNHFLPAGTNPALVVNGLTPVPGGGAVEASGTKFQWNWATANDAAWQQFIGAAGNNQSSWRWGVFAGDSTGVQSTQHAKRYITTGQAGSDLSAGIQIGQLPVTEGHINYFNSVVATPDGSAFFTQAADGLAGYSGAAFGDNWNGKVTFTATGAVGDKLDFFYMTGKVGPAPSAKFANAAQWEFGPVAGGGVGLVYSTAPVPEAETWAMFVAGLLGVGAIARRRLAV